MGMIQHFFRKGEFVLDDRLTNAIGKEGRLPTREEILHDLESDGRKAVYGSLMLNIGDERDIGIEAALHQIFSMYRRHIYRIGRPNVAEINQILQTHDEGENKGSNTIPGSFTIDRFVGNVSGADIDQRAQYEEIAHRLTDYGSMPLKFIMNSSKELLARLSNKLTQDEILVGLDKLEGTECDFIFYADMTAEAALKKVRGKIERFQEFVRGQRSSLPSDDVAFLNDLVGEYSSAVEHLEKNPVPREQFADLWNEVKALITNRLSNPIELGADCYKPNAEPIRRGGESDFLHAASEIVYEDIYLRRRLKDWIVSRPESGWRASPVSKKLVLPLYGFLAKTEEATDNIGTIDSTAMRTLHRRYTKAMSVYRVGKELIEEFAPDPNNPDEIRAYEDLQSSHKTLKRMIMYRVINDYGKMGFDRDNITPQRRQWVQQQFERLVDTFGLEFAHQYRELLRTNPKMLALESSVANKLMDPFGELLSSYESSRPVRKRALLFF